MVKKPPKPPEPFAFEGENDIVTDILRMVIAMAPEFSAELARRVEREAKERWGGDRVYIPRHGRRAGPSQRDLDIRRDHANGERIAYLERKYGIKRSRLWEIIKGGS